MSDPNLDLSRPWFIVGPPPPAPRWWQRNPIWRATHDWRARRAWRGWRSMGYTRDDTIYDSPDED